MRKFVLVVFLVSAAATAVSQSAEKASLGLGLGIPYGGFGAKLNVFPVPNLGFFAGGGYAIAGFGYNVGLMGRLNPDKKVMPVFSFMYGYTAALQVNYPSPTPSFNKLYYGPSIGFGIDMKSKNQTGYFTFGLVYPFRPAQYKTDLNSFKSQGVTFVEPLPIGIVFGYQWIL